MPVYLKLGDVKGWSKGKGHVGWIELESASIGFDRAVSSNTQGEKGAEINCTKTLDAISTTLIRMNQSGAVASATIDFVGSDEKIYLQLELKDVIVSSYSVSPRGYLPPEHFTLHSRQVAMRRFSANAPFDFGALFHRLFAPGPMISGVRLMTTFAYMLPVERLPSHRHRRLALVAAEVGLGGDARSTFVQFRDDVFRMRD